MQIHNVFAHGESGRIKAAAGDETSVQTAQGRGLPRLQLMQIEARRGVAAQLKLDDAAVEPLRRVATPRAEVAEVVEFGDAAAWRGQPAGGDLLVAIHEVAVEDIAEDHP